MSFFNGYDQPGRQASEPFQTGMRKDETLVSKEVPGPIRKHFLRDRISHRSPEE
jgi:hypothetical protein